MLNNQKILPLGIIGAGPAGLTAAIYAKRANLEPIIFTSEIVCGKVAKTLLIENYPAFKSTTGAKLCEEFAQQIKYLKIKVIYEKVNVLNKKSNGLFELFAGKEKFIFEKVIIATGTREKKLPVPGVETFHGRGVSYCSSCDGYFFKGLKIAVIGGGNAAIEESKVLAQIAKEVTIINRDAKLGAEAMLIEEINALENVVIHHNMFLKEVLGTDQLETLILKNTKTNHEQKIKVDGLFIFIGSLPNTNFINQKWKILDEANYIITKDYFQTTIPNLYAIGDVVKDHIQQYTTAMSSATVALQHIIKKGFSFIPKNKK